MYLLITLTQSLLSIVLPAEKRLGEVVLGSVLELHAALQQHLVVKLPLLLLLLQMLLHAKPLPVILLNLLCGASALDRHTINHGEKKSCLCVTFKIKITVGFVIPEQPLQYNGSATGFYSSLPRTNQIMINKLTSSSHH